MHSLHFQQARAATANRYILYIPFPAPCFATMRFPTDSSRRSHNVIRSPHPTGAAHLLLLSISLAQQQLGWMNTNVIAIVSGQFMWKSNLSCHINGWQAKRQNEEIRTVHSKSWCYLRFSRPLFCIAGFLLGNCAILVTHAITHTYTYEQLNAAPRFIALRAQKLESCSGS